jgi:hypothetical protein
VPCPAASANSSRTLSLTPPEPGRRSRSLTVLSFLVLGLTAPLSSTHLVGADFYASTLRAEVIVRATISRKRFNVGAIRATILPIHNV